MAWEATLIFEGKNPSVCGTAKDDFVLKNCVKSSFFLL